MRAFSFILVGGLAGLMFLRMVYTVFNPEEEMPPAKQHYYEAREKIASRLKNPAGAKFSSPLSDPDTGASELGNGIWEASGYVDAQNGFGAVTRENWILVWDTRSKLPLYSKIGKIETGDYKAARELASASARP